jgi:ABC-2 type transport system permease protein
VSRFSGTLALVPPVLRRDRVRILVWVVSIVALVVVTVASTKNLFPTQADLDRVALATKDNPAAAAFNGPPIALDTIGGQIAFQLGSFGLTVVGLMSLLMTSRWTRGEEDSGRLELVRAMPVGRHAPLTSAVLTMAGIDVVLGLLSSVALASQDLPVAGSFVLGMSFTALGLVFVGLTALTAQLTENPRISAGIAGAVLGASYAIRAIGDGGDGTLSWFSPIGWAQKARPYAGDTWWPLLLCVLVAGGLLAVAYALSVRRDFGAGLVPPRRGPARAAPSLGTELGLATRLQRAAVAWWTIGVLALAGVTGSLVGTIDDFARSSGQFADYFERSSGASLTDSYLATSLLLLALLAGGAAIQVLLRIRAEENDNRAEAVLATPTTRWRWFGSHLAVALAGSGLALVAGGLGLGLTAAPLLHDAGEIGRMVAASLAYLPALWALVGFTVLLLGLFPRAASVAWGAWSICVVLALFETIIDIPGLVRDLSPFEHIPLVPANAFTPAPPAVLAGIAVVLTAIGGVALRRRDIG